MLILDDVNLTKTAEDLKKLVQRLIFVFVSILCQ